MDFYLFIAILDRMCPYQFLQATDLEVSMKKENPAVYHEAWGKLCSAQ